MSTWDNTGPILAFFCNWAPYRCLMELADSGQPPLPPIHPIKVMCAGRVDPAVLLYAFEKGASGVLLLGCRDRECPHGPGPAQSLKVEKRMKSLMHVLGLESRRLTVAHYASHESKRLHEDIRVFAEELGRLGPSPLGVPFGNQ